MGVCLTLTACMFVHPDLAESQSVEELRSQIQERNNRLGDIEKEIARYQSELLKVGAEKDTLQKAINQLELERKKVQADIRYTEGKIDATDLEINKLTLEISDTEDSIDLNKRAVGETLQALYESDDTTLVEALLAHDTLSDFWNSVDELDQIRRTIRDVVDSLVSEKILLDAQHNATTKKRTDLLDLREQYSDQSEVLVGTKAEKDKLLAATKNEEAEYQKLLADKRAEKARFESELRELEARLQFTLDPSSIPQRGTAVFAWPLKDVYITQMFGQTTDSVRLYKSGTHNGVDFRAPTGTQVLAALSGTVVEVNTQVANMCQYGKWVLIRHNNGLTTLYAHLSVVSVNKGDTVSTGQIIGYSGNTGYAIGSHLHFTVYASAAVKFTQYTCNSGITLNIPIAAENGYLDPLDYLPY